jgi:DNA-binding NtrC family response regulator
MKDKVPILIVEDERSTRDGLLRLLRGEYEVTLAEDGERGLNLLRRHDYEVVLTDLRMPGADGMEVLRAALARDNPPSCIVMTAYGSIEAAVEAMRAGAVDFITKPVNLDQLEVVIRRAIEARRLKTENLELKRRLDQKFGLGFITGESPVMHEVFETVKQVAPTRATVLLTGESGTGKELIAQAIHQLSGRRGPFVPVHCAALPGSLLESELFGHEKGAFTGASEQRKGRFELADGGTLMLDEIGEIEPAVQVKLLRVLETRAFERVGSNLAIHTDARIIAATNRDLQAMVERGEFREDLYYRLVVVNLPLPPLRARPEDIPLLIRRFIDEFSRENQRDIAGIAEDALNLLCAYDWPGNVRELRNTIERMVVLSRDRELQVRSIPPGIREKVAPGASRRPGRGGTLNLEANERMLIDRALEQTDGNRTRAADALGISRRTLQRKMHLFGLG